MLTNLPLEITMQDDSLLPTRKPYNHSDEIIVPTHDQHANDMLGRELLIDDMVVYSLREREWEGKIMALGTISKFLGNNAVEVRRIKAREKGKEHCRLYFPSKGDHLYKISKNDVNDLMLLLLQGNKTLSEL